ncbi:MAG: gliding motility-associated C-terminal domain-containing protein [Flavihumibacter sp.]
MHSPANGNPDILPTIPFHRVHAAVSSAVMLLALLLSLAASAQELPPLQPEQDACNALYLCGNSFTTPFSYTGPGAKNDFGTTPCGGEESNSMWMEVKIAGTGILAFDIIPINPDDDYDFAVFDITGRSCEKLNKNLVVRCNFNNNFPGSNPGGVTGIRPEGKSNYVQSDHFGDPFLRPIDARAGQTFLIMINNFGNYVSGGPSSGFTIDFSASTAIFEGSQPPVMNRTVKSCSDSSVTIGFSMPIRCSSIAADGSDFYTDPYVPVTGVTPLNCTYGNGYTREVTIHLAGKLPRETPLTIYSRVGSDGNTYLNLCDDAGDPGQLSFRIPPQIVTDFLPAARVKCYYDFDTLAASRPFVRYAWSTGATTPTTEVEDPGVYTLTVTDTNTCVATMQIQVIDSLCPEYFYIPNAFSPNGDGKNDVFRPIFMGSPRNFRFSVYNRYGQQVFDSNKSYLGWDGRINNEPQPPDTYVWVCRFRLFKKEQMKKGTVMLVR